MDAEWMADGKCREIPPATFFPSDGIGVQVAQRICAECPVSETCLEYALAHRIDHGVWGGRSDASAGASSAAAAPPNRSPRSIRPSAGPARPHAAGP